MLDAIDIRTVIEVIATLVSAVAVVVALKTDIKWVTRTLDQHIKRDEATFTEMRREFEALRNHVFNQK